MLKPDFRWMALVLLAQPAAAEVKLAPLFQDGGVLQRDNPLPVWGKATPGKKVSVTFAGSTQTATADPMGRWQVSLGKQPANTSGQILTVTEEGLPPVEVKDILIGEVWLASGQSNMQWDIKSTIPEDQAEAAAGPVPLMRLFQVPMTLNNTRQDTLKASWAPATPENVKSFSAVAYFFGKNLAADLNVPIGMIHSSWGGSRIEPWWAEEGLAGIDELADLRKQRLAKSPGFPEYDKPFREYVTKVRNWTDEAAKALDAGFPAPQMPKAPELLKPGHNQETGTYQAMIHPLVPYALRGFIWYQGESNNGEGMLYTAKMKALIAGWRGQFKAAEAPFLFVQLASYDYGTNRAADDLPEIWWAQQKTLEVPHTGMAITTDISTIKDIHPRNKGEVGRRLARWALADTYGKTDIVKSGPLFKNYKANGDSITVTLEQTGGGLATRDGKTPDWFEIAATDGEYHKATATISGDGKSITLASPEVSKPDRARFAWSQIAQPNLMNREGLPAGAFNTHWPVDPTLGTRISGGKPHKSSHPNSHGWDLGLTEGTWGNGAPTCYATDESDGFPKTVTVDLGASQVIHVVRYGTPDVGSTKTVAVSISEDGKTFKEVGKTDFPMKRATTAQARFAPEKARFIRATFVGNHTEENGYHRNFGFLSELEAYAP